MRRTLSADTIYIAESNQSNPWSASLHTYCGRLMMDRSTQTPWEWEEMDLQRSSDRKMSKKTNDQIDIIVKANSGSKRKTRGKITNSSTVNNSITSTSSSTTSTSSPSKINVPAASSPQHQNQNQHRNAMPPTQKSGPIPIPANNRQLSPISAELMNNRSLGRNSVEELNQEIERLVLEGILGNSSDPPEGHRAPIAELFSSQYRRTANTQTPSSVSSGESSSSRCTSDDSSCPSSTEHSRPDSPASPVHIVSRRRSKRRSNIKANYGTSPEINKFLTREPPDGCEKVKIVNEEEARKRGNLSHVVLAPCPQKPANPGFVLLPSQSSAFLPLYKNNCYTNSSPDSLTSNSNLNHIYEKRMNDINSKSH